MNGDIIFLIALLAIYALRFITGKKRPQAPRPSGVPPSLQGRATRPELPGQARLPSSDAPFLATTPAPGREQQQAPGSDFEQAIAELKTAFGWGTPPTVEQVHRDPEAFGESEENFEKLPAFATGSLSSEELFESRSASFSPLSDREDSFEKRPAFTSSSVFYDDGFEKKPASTEVSFRGAWKGHESDFEYHSALEKQPRLEIPTKTAHRRPASASDSGLHLLLESSTDLQKAVVMHEILGLPVSLRQRSPRRRPF